MATSLDSFLPNVLIDIPEIPYQVAIHHLRNAAIEFCIKTTVIRSDLTFTTVADQGTYTDSDFTLPTDQLIYEIYDGTYGELNELIRKTPEQLNQVLGYNWKNEGGRPQYITREDKDTVRLVGAETAGITVTIPAAFKPTQTATSVDDDLYDDWHESIAYGALARIYKIARKPWTDIGAAELNQRIFEAEIIEAQRRAENAFMKPTRVVRYGGI